MQSELEATTPLIIDEPSDIADRQAAHEWFEQTYTSFLGEPKKGAVTVVAQHLHEEDQSGDILDSGEWEHLNLPINDSVKGLTQEEAVERTPPDALRLPLPEGDRVVGLHAREDDLGGNLDDPVEELPPGVAFPQKPKKVEVTFKPNRRMRRAMFHTTTTAQKYRCGTCGGLFIAPAAQRCQCRVPRPGRKAALVEEG